ncbi:MAG: fructosamine kinase family protein [Spirochaeta sp.]
MSKFTVVQSDTFQKGIAALFGETVTVRSSDPVAGGCINQGKRIVLSNGTVLFCKQNSTRLEGMFLAEAQGLAALIGLSTRVAGPRVPTPVGLVQTKSHQFLLLEWIESGRRTVGGTGEFGVSLAAMHAAVVATTDLPGYIPEKASDTTVELPEAGSPVQQFGFVGNNYIGSTPQENTWESSWVDFFAEHRLRYQLNLAKRNGLINSNVMTLADSVLSRLSSLLPEPDHPSMLHGDLWNGNMMVDQQGSVVLIDPAVYLGHSEADIAMMELFGSPGSSFFDAYQEIIPIPSGYDDRREIYNLYHLLNHLNLFGSSYRAPVMRVLERFS